MERRSPKISPKTLLLAIFEHSHEIGRTTERDLCAMLGVGSHRIAGPLEALRKAGFVQEDSPRLTFVGLAAAMQLRGAMAWDHDDRRHVA